MSVKVSSWVWHGTECADLMGNELVLMLALADVAGDDGRCRYMEDESDMTYTALAAKVRVDRRTIIRLVAKLRTRRLLVQVPGQNGRPNEFTVVVPWASKRTGDNVSPVAPYEPVTSETGPVTSEARTGDKSDDRSSYRRNDVLDVEVLPHTFDEFWAIWPRKDSKKDAAAAWAKAVKRADPNVIFEAARVYASSPHRPEKQFVPYGATWLNKDRWEDPPPERAAASGKPMPVERMRDGMDMLDRLAASLESRIAETKQPRGIAS